MQYVLLIYTPELGDDVPPEAIAAEMDGVQRLHRPRPRAWRDARR